MKKNAEARADFQQVIALSPDSTEARDSKQMLDSLPMPTFVLTGNHDPLHAGGVWERSPWDQKEAKRVQVLREAVKRTDFKKEHSRAAMLDLSPFIHPDMALSRLAENHPQVNANRGAW